MVPEEEEDDLAAMGFGTQAPAAEPVRAEPDVIEEEESPEEPPPAPEAKEEEVIAAVEEEDEPPAQPAPTPPPVPALAPPPAAAAPAPAPAPLPVASANVPAPATSPESTGIVVVDVEPSPGAVKFLGTVSEVGQNLSTLEAADVSDGMFELSKRCSKDMAQSFTTFKEHALDLAVTATSEAPPGGEGRLRTMARQAELRKLAGLPLAALYAVFALCCLCAFAVIYYPKRYAPMLYSQAKTKMLEYGVDQKAAAAAELAKAYTSKAYETATKSEIAAKSAETLGKAYTTVVTNPSVAAVAGKTGEAADQLRSKLAEKLVELKGAQQPVSAATASGAV
jgi:hypothetical protein